MVLQAPTPREAGNPVLTDFARDHAFTIAWFGLMTFVWFDWGQEAHRPAGEAGLEQDQSWVWFSPGVSA